MRADASGVLIYSPSLDTYPIATTLDVGQQCVVSDGNWLAPLTDHGTQEHYARHKLRRGHGIGGRD